MKSTRYTLIAVLLTSLLQVAHANDEVPHMLFLTQSKGFKHGSVNRKEATRSPAELAIMQLAKKTGLFTVYCSQNAEADFTKESLNKYDIVAFYTSGDLPIDEETFDYFLKEWLPQEGHGFLGFHSATDTFKKFEPYWDLVGGTFNGHPWGSGSKVTLVVHDDQHPAMEPFGASFEFQDEIYQYSNWQPEKVRVLMSLDMENTQTKRPWHVPVAWCKQIGEGKLFYNNMGHRESTWSDERYLESIARAVRWIDGQLPGSAQPNPDVSQAQHDASVKFSNAAGMTIERVEAEKRAREEAAKARREAQKKKAK